MPTTSTFLVWRELDPRWVPRFQHPTYNAAKNEADRLAKANPNVNFYVIETKGYVRCEPVYPTLHFEFGVRA